LALVAFAMFDKPGSRKMVCKSCGHAGNMKSKVRGSLAVEIAMWCLLIVPGIIYSTWRGSSRHKACPECGSTEIIPAGSPMGRRIISQVKDAK
jgi:hypothetical protein